MDLELSVSEFVDLFNQTLEFAYPSITIVGELSNYRVSKNKWVYFDLKDDSASIRFFGNVFQLPGPLEDGMLLKVTSAPRLHPLYGFTMNIQRILLSGEGTIKKAAQLLEQKLTAEGLFAAERKRPIPYPPQTIGLIASKESAAYSDFTKIIDERWVGLDIYLCDVQVQGEVAAEQIVEAIRIINQRSPLLDVLVLTRGGGSQDDLQTFNVESVVRAIAGSRIPTVVAIGHERDFSLAEAAADLRASTPTNAAELLVPDKQVVLGTLTQQSRQLHIYVSQIIQTAKGALKTQGVDLSKYCANIIKQAVDSLKSHKLLLEFLNPTAILGRGYALIRKPSGKIVKSLKQINNNDIVNINLTDGIAVAEVKDLQSSEGI
jgi:exodeoxyribonuclease VII large subunit